MRWAVVIVEVMGILVVEKRCGTFDFQIIRVGCENAKPQQAWLENRLGLPHTSFYTRN